MRVLAMFLLATKVVAALRPYAAWDLLANQAGGFADWGLEEGPRRGSVMMKERTARLKKSTTLFRAEPEDGDDSPDEDGSYDGGDEDEDQAEKKDVVPAKESQGDEKEESDREEKEEEKKHKEVEKDKYTKGKDDGEKERDRDGDGGDEDGAKTKKSAKHSAAPRTTTNDKGEPIHPGCYVFMPDGCPGKAWGPTPWKRDAWGEANVGAGRDRDVCENKRKIKFNNWCGKTNAKMLFIEGLPSYPSEPGCFYWHPTGCPQHEKKIVREWTKDESDEGITQEVCEEKRKAALDKWCGVSDTKTFFVHPKPETPEYPGCYVWMPNGCARHKFDASKGWKRDAWGEDRAEAGQDKAVCEKRKFSFDSWCGISDTEMLFVKASS